MCTINLKLYITNNNSKTKNEIKSLKNIKIIGKLNRMHVIQLLLNLN